MDELHLVFQFCRMRFSHTSIAIAITVLATGKSTTDSTPYTSKTIRLHDTHVGAEPMSTNVPIASPDTNLSPGAIFVLKPRGSSDDDCNKLATASIYRRSYCMKNGQCFGLVADNLDGSVRYVEADNTSPRIRCDAANTIPGFSPEYSLKAMTRTSFYEEIVPFAKRWYMNPLGHPAALEIVQKFYGMLEKDNTYSMAFSVRSVMYEIVLEVLISYQTEPGYVRLAAPWIHLYRDLLDLDRFSKERKMFNLEVLERMAQEIVATENPIYKELAPKRASSFPNLQNCESSEYVDMPRLRDMFQTNDIDRIHGSIKCLLKTQIQEDNIAFCLISSDVISLFRTATPDDIYILGSLVGLARLCPGVFDQIFLVHANEWASDRTYQDITYPLALPGTIESGMLTPSRAFFLGNNIKFFE